MRYIIFGAGGIGGGIGGGVGGNGHHVALVAPPAPPDPVPHRRLPTRAPAGPGPIDVGGPHHGGDPPPRAGRRAPHAAIRDRGLHMRTPSGPVQIDVAVTDDVGTLSPGAGDVVLLCTKSQDSEAALDAIASASSPAVAVVCAQNGVDNERMAL